MERPLKEVKVIIKHIWREWAGFSLTIKLVTVFFGTK